MNCASSNVRRRTSSGARAWARGRWSPRGSPPSSKVLLVIQIDGYHEARRLRKFARRNDVAAIITPTEWHPRGAEVDPGREVAVLPPGIAGVEREGALRTRGEGNPLSLAILGSAHGLAYYRALFEALRAIREVGPERFVIELPEQGRPPGVAAASPVRAG